MKEHARLDWQAARERLERSRLALEKAFAPDPEFVREVLRKRAARLAARAEDESVAAGEIRVVLFHVAGERYAIDIRRVAEVFVNPPCVPVPGSPAALRGVMQVHGEICPVWHLARLIGSAVDAPESSHTALLLRHPRRLVAVDVTAVEEIRSFRRDDFLPPPAALAFAEGISSEMIALLDVEKILKEAVR